MSIQNKKKIFNIVKELGALETVDESMKLKEDAGLDSLGMVMLLITLEEEFDISLSQSDMDPFALKTVGDIIGLTDKYEKEGRGD